MVGLHSAAKSDIYNCLVYTSNEEVTFTYDQLIQN